MSAGFPIYQVAEGANPKSHPLAGLDPIAGSGTNLKLLILFDSYVMVSCAFTWTRDKLRRKKRRRNGLIAIFSVGDGLVNYIEDK